MSANPSGRIDVDQNPCNPAINIHLAPGQQSPGISIFDALGNLVQSFPIVIPSPSLSGAVILAPNTPTRNTIQPTADVNGGLLISPHSTTQTGPLLGVGPTPSGGPWLNWIIGGNDIHNGICFQAEANATAGNGDTIISIRDRLGTEFVTFADSGSGGNATVIAAADVLDSALEIRDFSNGSTNVPILNVLSAVSGANVLEVGPGAKIGFFGSPAIVRPGATVDLRQALINLGLYTTGGTTPLNLNGGGFQASTISDLVRDAATSITTQMILLTHQSTGTPTAGYGSHIEFALDDDANVNKRGGKVSCEWVTPTDGSTVSSVTLHAAKVNSFVPCLVADGNQRVTIPGDFFHNGLVASNKLGFFQVGPVAQQANASQAAITAVLDANAKSALQAVYNLLKNYGLAPATA